jgi:predicted short-subunit dehydrogenase-like oxidoreductase (DUF2520 family)
MRIGFIGAGKVGTTLAYLMQEGGYPIKGFASRRYSSALSAASLMGVKAFADPVELAHICDVLFITTPDTVIEDVCTSVASGGGVGAHHIVVHTSGAHSTRSLESARLLGAGVLSLHPLQTVAGFEAGKKNLPGSYFSAEGDPRGLSFAKEVVASLKGNLLEIPTDMKPLYHASACVVSNYFVAIIHLGLSMMAKTGVSRQEALLALLPLIKGTLGNIEALGVPDALTGPIARGDSSTLEVQLRNMEEVCPELVPVYKQIGNYTVAVAAEKMGFTQEKGDGLRKILEG